MESSYILAIDQGTSSTKTIVFDDRGGMVARGIEPLRSYHTEGGFVEQDAADIYQNVLLSVQKCLEEFKEKGLDTGAIRACGISNQRETFVVWDASGKPLHHAVVWQCKRSIAICERLKESGIEPLIREKTGLLADPYFSASKMIWLNENVPAIGAAVVAGEAYFGTIDTWLLYRLTGGASYLTDYTNASRTMLFNLAGLHWDEDLLQRFGLSGLHLPEAKPSAYPYGQTDFGGLLRTAIPITAMIGDSHAAAFGEGCFTPGAAKATLGTGCSILMNTGSVPRPSQNGMVTTICWSTGDRVDYALEGVIVTCGATIEWLRSNLGLFADSRDTEAMATAVPDNNGIYLVPAFSGLGAPHWDMNRKAAITGLTLDATKNHIVRAALESIPYQIKDVIAAMERDAGMPLNELMADGGITGNRFVLQLLADLLGKPVLQIGIPDVSALGAALLAGLEAGIFNDLEQLKHLTADRNAVLPGAGAAKAQEGYAGWQTAIREGAC